MNRTSIVFWLWIAVTIILFITSSACVGSAKPITVAKPKSKDRVGWCVIGQMTDGTEGMFCTNRPRICEVIRGRAVDAATGNPAIGLVGLTDCFPTHLTVSKPGPGL